MRQKNKIKAACILLTLLIIALLPSCGQEETTASDSEESNAAESSIVITENEESESEESILEETDEYVEVFAPAVEIEDGYCDGDLYGTLVIEEADIKVPLYYTTIIGDGNSAQEIIDNTESAGYFRYGEQHVIADHDYQEFHSLKEVQKGTKAVISLEKGYEKTYECIRVCDGKNLGHLYDENKEDIAQQNPGGISMYTCDGSEEDVIICFFEQIVQ